MRFEKFLPQVKVGERLGGIENSGRIYACVVCKSPTAWRDVRIEDCPGVPCCSNECAAEIGTWNAEAAPNSADGGGSAP